MEKDKKQILKRFMSIGRKLRNFNLHNLLDETDLKQTEFAVLHMLDRHRQNGETEMKISDVAMHLRNATSTISPVIQSLVEKDFITRTRSKKDRRISMIVLTEQGEVQIQKVMHNMGEAFSKIITLYGEEKITLLLDLFDEFTDTIITIQKEDIQHD